MPEVKPTIAFNLFILTWVLVGLTYLIGDVREAMANEDDLTMEVPTSFYRHLVEVADGCNIVDEMEVYLQNDGYISLDEGMSLTELCEWNLLQMEEEVNPFGRGMRIYKENTKNGVAI